MIEKCMHFDQTNERYLTAHHGGVCFDHKDIVQNDNGSLCLLLDLTKITTL